MVDRSGDAAAAQYEKALTIMASSKVDIKKATSLLREALRMGEPRAAYALGTWYFSGANGFKENKKKGIELIRAAAHEKVPAALFDLAACYEEGLAVEIDLEKAFILFLDAAIHGDEQAVFEVSRCYFHGIGIEQNRQISEIWGARAEELGTYRDE